jgi:hypothetical protein
MANLGIDTYSGICSYILYRHFGGASPDGVLPLTSDYATFDPLQPEINSSAGDALVFKDDRALAESPPRVYPKTDGFICQGIQYINDSASSIFFSLDGIRDHFELKAGENFLYDWIKTRKIWLRGAAGGEAYRLVVW